MGVQMTVHCLWRSMQGASLPGPNTQYNILVTGHFQHLPGFSPSPAWGGVAAQAAANFFSAIEPLR